MMLNHLPSIVSEELVVTSYLYPSNHIVALSLVYMVMYIPMVFPAGLFLDRAIPRLPGGLRWGLSVGIVGSAVAVCYIFMIRKDK